MSSNLPEVNICDDTILERMCLYEFVRVFHSVHERLNTFGFTATKEKTDLVTGKTRMLTRLAVIVCP